ncbi:MAG: hypothetical protein DRG09_02785 [Epsilonproteobacteria bacterium]|nr:MAG: hypothetical protein DRG09_02785 [Campylobacterota bacterium]
MHKLLNKFVSLASKTDKKNGNSRHLDTIISAMADLMYLVDKEGNFLEVYADNKKHLLPAPKKVLLRTSIPNVFDAQSSERLMHMIQVVMKTKSLQSGEFALTLPLGVRYFEKKVIPLESKKDQSETVMIISRDITEKKQQEADARLIETVFQEASGGMLIEDKEGNIIHANNTIGRMLGLPSSQLIGKNFDYLSTMITQEIKDAMDKAMMTKGHWQGEVEISPSNSKKISSWLTINTILDDQKEPNHILIMITDISETSKVNNKMDYLASYDTLTDLPNRAYLFEQLKQSIATMQQQKRNGMLLFIDIDHFKEFNDNYGHQIGDEVLLSVSKQIKSICRKEDVLGRLSGDEFLLISENVNDQHAVETIIEKIQTIFKKPQKIGNLSLHISVSMGVALYPEHGQTPETLINAADQAMYSVKKQGRNNHAFYTEEMSFISNEYYFILNTLKDAIYDSNFTLVYQPLFFLEDMSLSGIEVLLRCNHSRLSDIPISRIISMAEETGLMPKITHLLLDMVCNQLHLWQLAKIKLPEVSINLSQKELHEGNLILTIHSHLSQYNIDPHDIELEITENALLQENVIVKENITRLQKLGHTFSIDDYGTGFSSLSNIKTFNFDKLKIDKSFISNLSTNESDQVIVSATIEMAKKLGLKVVAEGVETKEQAKLLKSFNCDIVQGFFYSKPLNTADIEKLLLQKQVLH